MTEEQFIDTVSELQRLSKTWNASRKRRVDRRMAVPTDFQTKWLDIWPALQQLCILPDGHPNFEFMDLVKSRVPRVSFYAGEKDSFGWVTGVMRVNNLELVF